VGSATNERLSVARAPSKHLPLFRRAELGSAFTTRASVGVRFFRISFRTIGQLAGVVDWPPVPRGAASQPGHDQVALNLASPIVIITCRPILNNRALTTARGRPAGAQPGRCGATIGHSDSLKSLASGALSADTLSGCSVTRHRALHRIVANPNHNTSKPHNFISGMLSVPAQNHPGETVEFPHLEIERYCFLASGTQSGCRLDGRYGPRSP
jgi:hypothetical protein